MNYQKSYMFNKVHEFQHIWVEEGFQDLSKQVYLIAMEARHTHVKLQNDGKEILI